MKAAPGLPLRLARLHQAGPPGSIATIPAGVADELLEGAGLARRSPTTAARLRTLPDIVGPRMRVLVCGLNPSLYAADAGVHYGRPGNRFWPAALAAGLVTTDRDPWDAYARHHVGWTDMVKRATVGAAELQAREFRHGATRLERLVAWLRPGVLCVVGLTGWRTAVDRGAVAGLQPDPFGGQPVYVMPNTSGLNARVQHDGFVAHLRAVLAVTDSRGRTAGGCAPPR